MEIRVRNGKEDGSTGLTNPIDLDFWFNSVIFEPVTDHRQQLQYINVA